MTSESRRMPRRAVTGTVDVIDSMSGHRIGQLGNLSLGGMLLMASTPLAEDALYQLRFALPDSAGDAIEVGAHVLWCDAASAPGQFWAGIRFLGLEPETTGRLRAWSQAS
ncbi:MAG: PilZ domain-containing protein [Thermomonas sp.]